MKTKQDIEIELLKAYGCNFKTALAKELGVDVSTVRRIFNGPKDIPKVYLKAIQQILNNKVKK